MRKLLTTSGVLLALVALLTVSVSVSAQESTPAAQPAEGDCPPMMAESTPAADMTVDPNFETDAFTFGENGGITINQFPTEYADILPGAALITFVNALESETNISFYRDDVAFSTGLSASGADRAIIPVDAGTYSFSIYDESNASNVLDEETDVAIVDSYYYVIAAVDGANGPELQVHEVSRAEYALATGQLAEPGTIIESLNAHGLCYLADAIEAAGLTETLAGEGPYTLFVPAEFLSDEVAAMGGDLETLLLNHVVEGDLKSLDLRNMEGELTSLAGNPLTVEIAGNAFEVNGNQVLRVNIPATNGTIHVIDGILSPDASE